MCIAEGHSDEFSASLCPSGVMRAHCWRWGGLCGDVRLMPRCLTFVDTQSSGYRDRDIVHLCRGRDSRHSACRDGPRPGRTAAAVIHRPTGLVAGVDRGPVRYRLRPNHRIALGGPLACVVQGQQSRSLETSKVLTRHYSLPASCCGNEMISGNSSWNLESIT